MPVLFTASDANSSRLKPSPRHSDDMKKCEYISVLIILKGLQYFMHYCFSVHLDINPQIRHHSSASHTLDLVIRWDCLVGLSHLDCSPVDLTDISGLTWL